MKKTYALLALLAGNFSLNAQTFIGSCDNDKLSELVMQDNYLYGIGITNSFGAGNGDAYLFKSDTSGHALWARQIGTSEDIDAGISLTVKGNNIFITCNIPHDKGSIMLMRLDTSGTVLRSDALNNTGTNLLESTFKADNGVLYCGVQTVPDHYYPIILSTDASGNIVWSKMLSGQLTDTVGGNGVATGILELSDGSILVNGSMQAQDSTRPFIAKLSNTGDLIWYNTYDRLSYDYNGNIIETPDGNYLVCGSAPRVGHSTQSDPYIIKIDANGNLLYNYVYRIDQSGGLQNSLARVRVTAQGNNVLLTGSMSSTETGENSDYYAMYIDSVGGIQWAKTYGDAQENILSNAVFTGSRFLLAGYSNENNMGNEAVGYVQDDILILKAGLDGSTAMTTNEITVNPVMFVNDTLGNEVTTSNFTFAPLTLSAYVHNVSGTYDSTSCIALNVTPLVASVEPMRMYPNPANTYTEVVMGAGVKTFDVMVHDATGNLVVSQSNITNGKALIDVNALSPGIYLVTTKSGQQRLGAQKLVVN